MRDLILQFQITFLMSTYGGSVLSEKKNGVWQQVLIRTTRTDLRGKAV